MDKSESALDTTLIFDVIRDKKTKLVWTVNATQPIRVAMKLLEEKKVRSLPVYDSLGKTYLGSVNVLDIVGFIASQAPKEDTFKNKWKELFDKSVKELLDFYKTEPFLPMFENYSLKLAVKALSGMVHAIPISHSKTGLLSNILSQSDVNKFIDQNGCDKFLGKEASISAKELKLVAGADKLYKVHSDAIVSEVLPILYEKKVSGVAVVNSEGKIVGNFSASDLAKLNLENFAGIYGPVFKFLQLEKQELSCLPAHAKLSEFVHLLATRKVHRVWIVDEVHKPIGLVSLTDVMRHIK